MTVTDNRASHASDNTPGTDPPSASYPSAGAIAMTDPRSTTSRALISELVELEHIIVRTPVITNCADGAVRISDGLRELLGRRRRIIGELRLRVRRSI